MMLKPKNDQGMSDRDVLAGSTIQDNRITTLRKQGPRGSEQLPHGPFLMVKQERSADMT